MARTFTIGEIKARCRRRQDMEGSGFVSDAELLDMINESYQELYDTLVAAFQNYFVSPATLTLTSGTAAYNLPADFYKVIAVELQTAPGSWSTLFPFNELERNSSLVTSSNVPNATVRLRYIPAPEVFNSDSDTIDGISGWEALLITDVAIMMLDKEESDTTALERRRQRLLERIESMAANRDVTMAGSVTDVTAYDNGYLNGALQYRFYGNQIEFINVQYFGI